MTAAVKIRHLELAASSQAFSAVRREVSLDSGHAFIFASPDTLLSRAIAYLLAAGLVCPDACLACKKCRRVVSGNCPDITDLSGGKVMTADMDRMLETVAFAPYELPYKLYLLDLSEKNDSVQNKFLKTLEEPPPGAKFIIITAGLSSLLPTVVSRCGVISPRLAPGELSGEGEDNPNLPYALYGALDSLTEFDGILSGKTVENLLCAAGIIKGIGKSGDIAGLLKFLPTGGSGARARIKKTLGYLELIYGDIMKAEAVPVNTYGLYDIDSVKRKLAPEGIPESLAAIRRADARCAGGNLSSVVDELLIKLTEVNYNAQSGRN